MASPFESVEDTKAASPSSDSGGHFDPIGLMAETMRSERTPEVLGFSVAGGLTAATAKLGVDHYALRNSLLQVTEGTFQSAVSDTAPAWAKSYLNNLSPSAAVARGSAENVKYLSTQLAGETRDFAAGAKLFTAPTTSLEAARSGADFMMKLRDPRLAINLNAPASEVLAFTKQNVSSIAGTAEREMVLSRMATLEREIAIVERPLFQAARASALPALLQGAAVGGISYAVDGELSKAARSYYGENSELGRVLEPTLTGSFLTGAGCVLGSNLRTKVAFTAAGWLTGKAINYFSSGS